MATMKMTGCMKIVSRMSEADQDALLSRLDAYQADGVPAERAQLMAAQDMLAEIQGERDQLFNLLREQHPDLFSVAESPAPQVQASRQRAAVRTPLGFYSALADGVDGIKTNAAPAQGWKDAIKGLVNKGAVKADEVEWSGVNDWLDLQQGKVTKEQVADYLKQGGVQVEEAVLRTSALTRAENEELLDLIDLDRRRREGQEGVMDDDEVARMNELRGRNQSFEPPRYEKYTLPGGENYREVLLTLPTKTPTDREGLAQSLYGKSFDDLSVNQAARVMNELASPTDGKTYRSNHWDQPNVLAHIRVNDRTDADGKRVLFVEELQSDWGQAGAQARKKEVKRLIAQGMTKEEANKSVPQEFGFGSKLRDGFSIIELEPGFFHLRQRGREYPIAIGSRKNVEQEGRAKGAFETGPPAAPFVTKTEGWLNLALKRVMVMAAEGGYDKVAFTTGEQNADRFKLSATVSSIRTKWSDSARGERKVDIVTKEPMSVIGLIVDKSGTVIGSMTNGMNGKTLDQVIGKEMAQEVMETEGDGKWSGLDLEVGGEGMKAFYDTIVPTTLKKLLPKVGGGQVSAVKMEDAKSRLQKQYRELPFGSPEQEAAGRQLYEMSRDGGTGSTLTQPGFDVTDAMREKVAEGLPLFSRRRTIFGSPAPLANWTMPAETKFDNWIRLVQDKQVDMKRVIEAISRNGGLSDQWNAYLQEELYHGRSAKATKDFGLKEVRPLMEELEKSKVSLADFEEYLHNRHAEERNTQIAKVNPAMPDGGSGIDTADARAYLAGLDPAKRSTYEALARRVDAISQGTRELLVRSGLETQDTINQWEGAYKNYVPLMREDVDYGLSSGMGTGSGFSVRGPASRRATGSDRPVVDILANLLMQRERAIVRAEKTRVGTALYGLALQNPNADFWLPVDPKAIKDVPGTMAKLQAMGLDPMDVRNIMEEPLQQVVDPRTGLVTYRVNANLRNADNVMAVRVNGEDKFLFFNTRNERAARMAASLKNLDAASLEGLLNVSGKISRYFAAINTQYNPIFGAINLLRDVQGAAVNLSSTPLAGEQAAVLRGVGGATLGIYRSLRADRSGQSGPPGSWSALWEEFQREGGQTGFRDMFRTSEDRTQALQAMLDPASWTETKWGKVLTAGGTLKVPLEAARKYAGAPVFNWLSDYNETLENAVRLSAYKAAKAKGMTAQQAASLAKNLTVNFNRKGEIGTQAGALYAFFNASVQGTARLAETLKGPAGKKILAGGLLLGTVQALALAAAGFDEDEPPDFIKERNFVIPTGDGKYLTFPMPLGLNVIPNTSRVLTEWALAGGKDPGKRFGQIVGAFADMFNPIGNAGLSVQTIAPTFADPLVALAENRDWSGKPIAKKDMTGTDPTPGYTRAKETASWVSKQLSYYLNLASGGTKYKPGGLSPTPDQIDYLIGQVTGGVGREILKVSQAVESSVTGEELPTYKVPIAGRFYGDTKEQAATADRFYRNVTRINEHENEIEGRKKNREGGIAEYRQENPEARLVTLANRIERDVAELRRKKREMLEKDRPKESIKMIELQITRKMEQLNARVEALQD